MKPLGKIKIKWSPDFAYAIGLLASDGHLSKDGRHIDLTSKDKDQLENFLKSLKVKNRISIKGSGSSAQTYFRVQFSDVTFYKFLLSIGLTPAKSKTIGKIDIPQKYFFDFLRGSFDGDGTFYSYWDPRWKSSFMFYTAFASASRAHLDWIREEIFRTLGACGHVTRAKQVCQLRYAKTESLKILRKMYHQDTVVCLRRKRLKILNALSIIGEQLERRARVVKW
ncbi:MAG: LAGLIDADG family homing endonuclease [Patescibacteria group bacterium]